MSRVDCKKKEESVPIEVGSEVIVFGDKMIKEAINLKNQLNIIQRF